MARLDSLRQWRPSRLGLKLFVAILSVNVAIAASMFLAVSYSIHPCLCPHPSHSLGHPTHL